MIPRAVLYFTGDIFGDDDEEDFEDCEDEDTEEEDWEKDYICTYPQFWVSALCSIKYFILLGIKCNKYS